MRNEPRRSDTKANTVACAVLITWTAVCWMGQVVLGADAATKNGAEQQELVENLVQAAQEGNLDQVKALISKGVRLDLPNAWGYTPLQAAASCGRQEIVDLLMAKGQTLDIFSASALGKVDVVTGLLEKTPGLVKAKHKAADTPLMWTVSAGGRGSMDLFTPLWMGRLAVAELLIKKGADVNAENNDGITALYLACTERGKFKFAELLIAKDANVNAQGKADLPTALFAAVAANSKNKVDLLLANKANVNAKNAAGVTPLQCAIWVEQNISNDMWADGTLREETTDEQKEKERQTNKEIFAALVTKGADVNAANVQGLTPLHLVARTAYPGWEDRVDILLAKGARKDARTKSGETPMDLGIQAGIGTRLSEIYAKHGHTPAQKVPVTAAEIRRLMDGPDTNKWTKVRTVIEQNPTLVDAEADGYGRTLLMMAAEQKLKATVEFLLAKGADVNRVCSRYNDFPVLYFAVKGGDKDIVTLMIEKGAEFKHKDVLYYAVDCKNKEMTELFLAKGADTEPKGARRLALGSAAGMNRRDLVERLLAKGAKINAADGDSNQTALHMAVIYGHLDMVKFLLENGADINAKMKDGKTALHLATQQKNDPMIKLLTDSGGTN